MLLFFFACARSRKLNTTLLLTRLPELNSGQNLAKKYMSAGGGNSACYRIWYVHDDDDDDYSRAPEPGRSAVAHEQIKWFPTSGRQQKRLFPYYKQAICKFNAPTVHQHFSSGIYSLSLSLPLPHPRLLPYHHLFLCENFAEYGFIAGRQACEASTQHEDRRQAACRQVIN